MVNINYTDAINPKHVKFVEKHLYLFSVQPSMHQVPTVQCVLRKHDKGGEIKEILNHLILYHIQHAGLFTVQGGKSSPSSAMQLCRTLPKM